MFFSTGKMDGKALIIYPPTQVIYLSAKRCFQLPSHSHSSHMTSSHKGCGRGCIFTAGKCFWLKQLPYSRPRCWGDAYSIAEAGDPRGDTADIKGTFSPTIIPCFPPPDKGPGLGHRSQGVPICIYKKSQKAFLIPNVAKSGDMEGSRT